MSERAARLRRPNVWIALALALGLSLSPAAGLAQETPQDGGLKGARRFIFALIGATVAAVPANIFNSGRTFGSNCTSNACVTLVTGGLGAAVGFLIGYELDQRHTRREAAGPSMRYDFQNIPLDLVPDRIAGFSDGAAVVGLGGARVIFRDGTVLNRGVGVRGIEDLTVLGKQGLLVLSTASSLLAFPVRGEESPGQVIDERGGGAVTAFQDELAVAGLDSLRLLDVARSGDEISVRPEAGRGGLDFITDMTYSRYSGVSWALMGERLVAFDPALNEVGELALPTAGRSVRANGGRLAVAAGSDGVYVIDARDPERPAVVQHFTGVRFAYGADLNGDVLYVAGGIEGVAVVDLSGQGPRVMGVAREMRFASDVSVTDDGAVWILDRDGHQVQVADIGIRGD